MQMSRMGIWKVIQEQGTQERQRQEVERKRLFEHGELPAATQARKPSAIVQLDGVLIGTRETAETELFNGRRRMEVKIATAFSGTIAQTPRRRRTRQRTVYGQIAPTEEFAEHWYIHCVKHGIDERTKVHLMGDGAGWIRSVQQVAFPGSGYTLDSYHLQRKAREILTQRQYRDFQRESGSAPKGTMPWPISVAFGHQTPGTVRSWTTSSTTCVPTMTVSTIAPVPSAEQEQSRSRQISSLADG